MSRRFRARFSRYDGLCSLEACQIASLRNTLIVYKIRTEVQKMCVQIFFFRVRSENQGRAFSHRFHQFVPNRLAIKSHLSVNREINTQINHNARQN